MYVLTVVNHLWVIHTEHYEIFIENYNKIRRDS